MAVSPSTVLKLAPDVSVQYRSGADVEISFGADRVTAGPHGVAILEAFRVATPMGEALKRLGDRTSGMQDWIELSAMIATFARIGILRDPATVAPTLRPEAGRFDSAHAHVFMLDDRTRTERYLEAIRAVVRPGDVVVEVGTGTGVLSVAAAQAGAARVYAIEGSAIGDSARRVFEANGVADRVRLIEGMSSRVTLPERCDVLIAELIGKAPLEEAVLEFTRDAVTRFLKPGGRLVPSRFEIFGVPVALPAEVLKAWTFTPEVVERWKEWYGIDFSPLVDSSRNSLWSMSVTPRRLSQFEVLSPPVRLLDRDLSSTSDVGFTETAIAEVSADGEIGGIALYFAATLAPGIVLDTDPRAPRRDNSWDHIMWGLPTPLAVRAGDRIAVTLRHRNDGPPIEVRLVNE